MILSNEKFLNLKEKHNIWTEKNLLDTLIFNAINNENKDVINKLKFKLQETLNNWYCRIFCVHSLLLTKNVRDLRITNTNLSKL